MCGIAGAYNYHSPTEPSMEIILKKMLSTIHHRGPDESGIYLGENLGLGSVRLSIMDLHTGQQPMCDQSGNYWIVYNGEIFNYIELRKELEKKGIRFKTECDTEVVVQMYAIHGEKCLQFFNGQFSFCIWNKKKQELFLARDRVGIRPLFYWAQNNAFAFCSEIKGLFTLKKIERAIKPESLAQIFTFWTTISPNTPFENIYELPPGHQMTVSSSGIQIKKYWSHHFPGENDVYSGSFETAVEELRHLLKDAVNIRLRADVPVAAYLSGGLDSSVTTAMIHEINPSVLNTFSIGFKDKIFDESPYQTEASKYFNTNHEAFECTSKDIADYFEKTVWHSEFPILRTSPTPMYMLSKKVRERNIKVVITGEGADEFLCGYNLFKEAKVRRFWANQSNSTWRPKLLQRLYPYLPSMKGSSNISLKMFFGYKLEETSNPLYSHLLRWHNTSRIKSFFSNDMASGLNGYHPMEELCPLLPPEMEDWTGLAKSQYLEATIFMSQYLLSSQGDRMAMGNSVEGRYPFLDYRVIEFCNKLPDRFKLNCLNEKFILKMMSAGKIPASITQRAKQPYRAPIGDSFSGMAAPEYVKEITSEKTVASFGLFDPQKVKTLFNKINSQKDTSEVSQMAVAGIVSSQLLYKMFIRDPIIPQLEKLSNLRIIQDAAPSYV